MMTFKFEYRNLAKSVSNLEDRFLIKKNQKQNYDLYFLICLGKNKFLSLLLWTCQSPSLVVGNAYTTKSTHSVGSATSLCLWKCSQMEPVQ